MQSHLSPLLRGILEAGQSAALVVDESGTILFANPQVSSLLEYGPGELDGRSVELLLPQGARLPHIGHRLRFTDERRERLMGNGHHLVACRKGGSELSVQISLKPVQHGLETLVIAVIVPTNERSRAANPPRAHNA